MDICEISAYGQGDKLFLIVHNPDAKPEMLTMTGDDGYTWSREEMAKFSTVEEIICVGYSNIVVEGAQSLETQLEEDPTYYFKYGYNRTYVIGPHKGEEEDVFATYSDAQEEADDRNEGQHPY